MKWVTALLLCAAFAIGFLGLTANANAATQAELEEKLRMLEQALGDVKKELADMKETQKKNTEEIAAKAAKDAMPDWIQRMEYYGDLRFRHQFITYDDLNGKSKDDRDRFLIRLRVGVKSQIHPDVKIGFRMATGADDNPTSTNVNMGGYFGEKDKWGIDRAYAIWTPSFVPDKMVDFSFGKIKNPFVTSKAIWDGDVVPEGAFLKGTFNKKGDIRPFLLAGAMFVEEHATDWPDDIYALAAQGGVDAKFGSFKLKAATAYTDWRDLGTEGNLPPNARGNTVYTSPNPDPEGDPIETLSSFKVWDLYAKATYKLSSKMALDVWGHYLMNTDASGMYEDEDTGYGFGAGIKYDKFKLSSWYKHVEANATPGFISDSDSGFVNRKGYIIGLSYKIIKPITLSVTYFDTEAVDETLPGSSNGYQMVLTQGVFKF
jgi:hypothetical protein